MSSNIGAAAVVAGHLRRFEDDGAACFLAARRLSRIPVLTALMVHAGDVMRPFSSLASGYQALSGPARRAFWMLGPVRFRSYSIRRHHAICLFKLGQAYQAIGSNELAVRYLEESVPMFRQLALPSYEQRAVRAIQDCSTLGHMAFEG